MSNIAELANCPELSFIESMTLQETEEQLRELVLLVVQPHAVGRRFQHVSVTVQRGVSHGQQRGGVDVAAPHQRTGNGHFILCDQDPHGYPLPSFLLFYEAKPK